jgi:hypothetical protein
MPGIGESHCSLGLTDCVDDERREAHLCGLNANLISVNGFGDILAAELRNPKPVVAKRMVRGGFMLANGSRKGTNSG